MDLVLSSLPKTWILDLDGTMVKHNGYLYGQDELLAGVKDFVDSIPAQDFILILTARGRDVEQQTVAFLNDNQIRFDQIIFGLPIGERIIINDCKPSGLETAIAVNTLRDSALIINVRIDEEL